MQATKNQSGFMVFCFAALALVLPGCTPPGPRALLDGKELLEKGHYAQAVEKLTLATSLLKTNAQAWNYLGLACHRAGDAPRAAQAYRRALDLDRELFEAHYNLGCLWLDQNKPDAAKSEFTACTLRRANSVEAWLKLAAAHYRLGESAAAEENFQKALRLSPNQPEALNGLGVVSVQRKRPREAAQYFNSALKQQVNYRPALLNLATVLHRDLNDSAAAVQRYREYLALQPHSTDWDAVNAVLQGIEQRQVPAPRVAVTNPAVQVVANSNGMKAQPPHSNALAPVKSNPPPVIVKPATAPTTTEVEVVKLPPEPVIRTASAPLVTAPAPAAEETTLAVAPPPDVEEPPQKPAKRSFLSRLNPFRRDSKSAAKATPLSAMPPVSVPTLSGPAGETASPSVPGSYPRYEYLAPAPPTAGNRAEADAAFDRGQAALRANKEAEAAEAFQQAARVDGSYFEAHYQLGLLQYSQRDYPHALATWEMALAVRPDSAEARYNFALTLKVAGYAPDAAMELEKILAGNAQDIRAHLVLGNIYAEQLRDKSKARVHYQHVLNLDSRHPNATQIRYWLVANPG